MNVFFEVGLIVILAGIGAYIARIARQPLIPAYIVVGVIVGPVLGLVQDSELVASLSEFGIAFLLFMVGLELEFKKLKDIGAAATATGALQIALSFIAGFGVAILFGMSSIESMYIGIVIALSSTMVVIKLISDRYETNTLHGRIIIGILVIQDIFAIAALSYLTSQSTISNGVGTFALKLVLVVIACVLAGKYIFPRVFEFAARSQELLLAISLSVCFLLALLFAQIGLSITIGAFFAGVLLANLPYNIEIASRVKSLRDFFAILFFTSLGMMLPLEGLKGVLWPTVALFFLVLLVKPLATYLILKIAKYTNRTAFTASVSLAQISEFSLIILAQGVVAGLVSEKILAITILLAILTMTSTSYVFKFESKSYKYFSKLLRMLKIRDRAKRAVSGDKLASDIILCGYDRIGHSILKKLREMRKHLLVVDFNPDVIKNLRSRGVTCLYGDINDSEVFGRLDISKAKMLISTANHYEDNLLLLKKAKSLNSQMPIIVTAHKIDEALTLYDEGADYVILPHFLGGDRVSELLPDFESNQLKILMHKYRHINDLNERKTMGHEHPLAAVA